MPIKEIKQKIQGKGTLNERNSWIIFYKDENRPPEIVFKDPSIIEKVDIRNVDLTTMSKEQIAQLKELLQIN